MAVGSVRHCEARGPIPRRRSPLGRRTSAGAGRSSAPAGTGRSRARLRRRHSAASVAKITATAGNPASRATAEVSAPSSRDPGRACPRLSSGRRRDRASMIVPSSANASSVAERSFSPLPTMARSSSDETISRRAKRAAAQADLPAPDAPTRTISAGSGSVAVAESTVTRVAVGSGLIGQPLRPPQAQAQPDVHGRGR